MSTSYDTSDEPPSTPPNKAGVWLEGECLVVPRDFTFPRICLLTGEADRVRPVQHTFQNLEIGPDRFAPAILVALSNTKTAKTVTLTFYLHERMKWRERWARLGVVLLFVAAMAGAVVILIRELNPGYALLVIAAAAVACAALYRKGGLPIYAYKVKPSYVWLRGIPKEIREAIYEAEKA